MPWYTTGIIPYEGCTWYPDAADLVGVLRKPVATDVTVDGALLVKARRCRSLARSIEFAGARVGLISLPWDSVVIEGISGR